MLPPKNNNQRDHHHDDDDDQYNSSSSSWFHDIRSLAQSTKDTLIPAIDGLANMIHRSAMTVAAEIAQLERDASGGEFLHEEEEDLPWQNQGEECKRQILELSQSESTFVKPHVSLEDDEEFVLHDARIDLIQRLLEMDPHLAKMHAKLSGRSVVKETLFWKNYFHHVARVKRECQQAEEEEEASSLGSLVPATSPLEASTTSSHAAATATDDGSYVCVRAAGSHSIASPPSSLNTLNTETMSVGDLVVVGSGGGGGSHPSEVDVN